MEGWTNPPRREVMAIPPEALEKESRVSVEWEQGLVQHYVQTFTINLDDRPFYLAGFHQNERIF